MLSAAAAYVLRPRTIARAKQIEVSDLGRRVMVIVPHPDDEILIAGGTIRRLLAAGGQVRVVIVTAGDGYYRAARRLSAGPVGEAAFRRLGDTRHEESLRAAAEIGLPASGVVSLGFPDAGTSALWDAGWSGETVHVGRGSAGSVPYEWASQPGATYSGRQLASQLVSQIEDFRPDTVIGPDTRETHPDHAAVAAFMQFALDEADFASRRLTAFVHFKHFPYPWAYVPSAPLSPPPVLVGDGSTWLALPLDAADERAKRTAIEEYRSQTAVPDLAVYMRAFVRRNELFEERPAAAPATQTTDARPAPGESGTLLVAPAPVIPPPLTRRARISSVRMVRGPSVTWVGIVTDRPIDPANDYRLSLRLTGGTDPAERFDVLVHDGVAGTLHVSTDGTAPAGVTSEADGRTLWIAAPSALFAGRTHALLGTAAGLPKSPPFRSAWRDIAL